MKLPWSRTLLAVLATAVVIAVDLNPNLSANTVTAGNEATLTLNPATGAGCVYVTAAGTHFTPGSVVTLIVDAQPFGDLRTAVGEAIVGSDGRFEFELPESETPFIHCDDSELPPPAGQYGVTASTGQLKSGEGLSEPSANATFTKSLSVAERFTITWARTDYPVVADLVDRTWIWGPESFTAVIEEPYSQASGDYRDVRYYDKTRMEMTDPDSDISDPWSVTNGLLAKELITGLVQFGDNEFDPVEPAHIAIAGDLENLTTPTYATFRPLMDAPATSLGTPVLSTVDRSGNVEIDSSMNTYGVTAAYVVPETGHSVSSVFWEFMNSGGLVWISEFGGSIVTEPLFHNPFYATGLPITEAYWIRATVNGVEQDVLVQAFERRVLTYTPLNDVGWQVEAGNVGRHYYEWRYGSLSLVH